MQPARTSIWLHDSNETASGKPGTLHIDSIKANVASLGRLASTHSDLNVEIKHGDANSELREFCQSIEGHRLARAVVFLDPFGLSVAWDTIVALANTQKVDLWYLVPVHAMSRQVSDNGKFLPAAERIDILWGSNGWRSKAVRPVDLSDDLFGGADPRLEKIAKAKQFSEMFRDHLKDVFRGGVADIYLPLGKGRLHEYSLMFACANPSEKAFTKALRIASHILRTA